MDFYETKEYLNYKKCLEAVTDNPTTTNMSIYLRWKIAAIEKARNDYNDEGYNEKYSLYEWDERCWV